jgi:hypothetical protein
VAPTTFWIGAVVAVGLPFVTLALIPFVFLHALRRNWLLMAIHLLVIVLVINRHWSVERLSKHAALRGDLTLMTFNTPRYPDTESAMKRIDALVSGVDPDLIGLQESVVWATRRNPEHLRSHRKFRNVVDSMGYATVPPRHGPEGVSWVRWVQPLLSRTPLISQDQFTFDRDVPGWPTLHVLRSELDLDGRRLAHYNIHLFTHGPSKPWNGDGDWLRLDRWVLFLAEARTSFRIRQWQAEQIRALIDDEQLPMILSGDFNGTADNWSYRLLARGLDDAFRVAGRGWGATYHASYPLLRIDFVLLGPEFDIVSARVPSEFETESDHRPLVVRFRWKSAKGAKPHS